MAKRIRGARKKTVWAVLFAAAVLLLCAAACAEGTQCVDSDGIVHNEHNWTWVSDDQSTHHKECMYCHTIQDGSTEDHNWMWIDDGAEGHHQECTYCETKRAMVPHNWSDWYTSSEAFETEYGMLFPGGQLKAPTCTEAGIKGRYCFGFDLGCGYTETAEAKALGHDLVSHEAKAATCTDSGWEAYETCAREGCGYTTYKEIPALGHDIEKHEAKAATCTDPGWEAYETCKRDGCGYTTYKEIPALGHDVKKHEAKAATCTEPGWEAYETCKRDGCGYTTYKEIPALGHDIEKHEAKAATCTEAGWEAYETCKREGCGYTTYKEIPAAGHQFVKDPAVEPTCEKPGKTAGSHCYICGAAIPAQQEIPATGHKPVEDPAVAATCEKPGKTAGSHCSVCGKVIDEQKEVPATGHKPVEDPAVAATCEQPGKTAGSHCSVCGKVIDEQKEVPATGHKPVEDAAVAATCEQPGKTAGSHCAVCGAVIDEQKEVPATGHSYDEPAWTWSGKTAAATFTCGACGKSVTVGASVSENREADGVRLKATAGLNGKSYGSELFLQDEDKKEEAVTPGNPGDSTLTPERKTVGGADQAPAVKTVGVTRIATDEKKTVVDKKVNNNLTEIRVPDQNIQLAKTPRTEGLYPKLQVKYLILIANAAAMAYKEFEHDKSRTVKGKEAGNRVSMDENNDKEDLSTRDSDTPRYTELQSENIHTDPDGDTSQEQGSADEQNKATEESLSATDAVTKSKEHNQALQDAVESESLEQFNLEKLTSDGSDQSEDAMNKFASEDAMNKNASEDVFYPPASEFEKEPWTESEDAINNLALLLAGSEDAIYTTASESENKPWIDSEDVMFNPVSFPKKQPEINSDEPWIIDGSESDYSEHDNEFEKLYDALDDRKELDKVDKSQWITDGSESDYSEHDNEFKKYYDALDDRKEQDKSLYDLLDDIWQGKDDKSQWTTDESMLEEKIKIVEDDSYAATDEDAFVQWIITDADLNKLMDEKNE